MTKYKITAKDTYKMVKVIDTEDYPNTSIVDILDTESYEIRKEYGKKYGESCGEVIIYEKS